MNRWEVQEDGYYRALILVQHDTDLIIGRVFGSKHEKSGWYAATDGPEGRKRLGEYLTEDLAKKAVENAQPLPQEPTK